MKNDIPTALNWARAHYPAVHIAYGTPLGVRAEVLTALEERVAAVEEGLPALPAAETAVLLVERGSSDPDANADLWTQNPGINQDLGIFVNDQLVAWKESGGFAGTFSPNAAFVQIAFRAVADQPYVVRLEWKSNIPTAGTIRAGAGLGPQYSPTSLTVEIPPAG